MSSVISTAGGSFDPERDRHMYFLACKVDPLYHTLDLNDYVLQAVDALESPRQLEMIEDWMDRGARVFLDSGIFNLAMTHARNHNVTHDVALNLAPDQIDGFTALYERYIDLTRRWGDRLWGYIELDQGGRENKIRTRAKLEALGLRPIPVYHPLADGWDYFDYLAQRYDRICFGNIVKANRSTRLRLLATLHERKRAYPHLWVHVLGLTPNEITYTYPPDSADSSAWLSSVRWSGYNERSCGAAMGGLPRPYQYELASDAAGPTGYIKAVRMSAYGAAVNMQNWRDYIGEVHDA